MTMQEMLQERDPIIKSLSWEMSELLVTVRPCLITSVKIIWGRKVGHQDAS